VPAADAEIQTLIAQYQEVEAQIRRSNPRYATLVQPVPLSARELQQQALDADTLLLEYLLGRERSYLWAVSATSVASFELPGRAEIETLAQRVYDRLKARPRRQAEGDRPGRVLELKTPRPESRGLRLRDQDEAQASEAAAALSRMLLGPVAELLGNKRLLIVADGSLQYVPFAALPDPTALTVGQESRPPLMVAHEIISMPSASTLAVLRRELAGRKPAAKTLAVLADPVFAKDDERIKTGARRAASQTGQPTPAPGAEIILRPISKNSDGEAGEARFSRLPFTRQEAEQIMALVAAGEGMKALDFEASRATAMSDQLSQYRYIHFATHGLADSERAELSTLVLSLFDEQGAPQEGFLRAHEIYNLNLPAELVTLSACETGLGKQVKGEGLVSLARGFMYAGAARVMVSLWNVNDQATSELMRRFYRKALVEGERPAAALRAAQIEMWRDKRWEAPYYWAAFTLQGEWR